MAIVILGRDRGEISPKWRMVAVSKEATCESLESPCQSPWIRIPLGSSAAEPTVDSVGD
jgi:hypothetical protein